MTRLNSYNCSKYCKGVGGGGPFRHCCYFLCIMCDDVHDDGRTAETCCFTK